MSTMLADVINAGTGDRRAAARLHAAGRRQDRHDQRLQRRLVRRLHAEARHRRVGRLRSAADDPAERVRGRRRGAGVGDVHEGGDARATSPSGSTPPAGVTTATVCRLSGKLADRRLRARRGRRQRRQIETRSMVYTEYFARGTEPTDVSATCTRRAGSSATLAGLFGSAATSRRRRRSTDTGAAAAGARRPHGPWRPAASRRRRQSTAAANRRHEEARLLVARLRHRRRGRATDD